MFVSFFPSPLRFFLGAVLWTALSMALWYAFARDQRLQRLPIETAELPGLADAVTPTGDVRTLPSMWAERGGLDGFYMARLALT